LSASEAAASGKDSDGDGDIDTNDAGIVWPDTDGDGTSDYLDTDSDAAALVTSIVMLGRSLGLQLVAEGVENFAQAEFLRTLECERVQGFHFYQPVSAEEVVGVGPFRDFSPLPA